MYEHIPNESLDLSKIPLPNAPWEEISAFALTFSAYNHWGGHEKVAEIANSRRQNDLTDLRTCLFFEQRCCNWSWSHFDDIPDEHFSYMRNLVRMIREELGEEPQRQIPDHLKRFILNEEWTFAKTYAKTWPHEYIVQQKVDRDLFHELANHIDWYGYPEYFYQTQQSYFDFDGYTYWHMENIINRCVERDTYHQRKLDGRLPME